MNYEIEYRHPGFSNFYEPLQVFFKEDTAKFIQKKIYELLKPHYGGRGVIVPLDKVIDVMNTVYANFRPSTGDIYSRYTIPSECENSNAIDKMINECITIIAENVTSNLDMQLVNSDLTIWDSVLGSFNKRGLRSHDVIKLKNRRPQTMLFNMNY